jgi:hypothetical protein
MCYLCRPAVHLEPDVSCTNPRAKYTILLAWRLVLLPLSTTNESTSMNSAVTPSIIHQPRTVYCVLFLTFFGFLRFDRTERRTPACGLRERWMFPADISYSFPVNRSVKSASCCSTSLLRARQNLKASATISTISCVGNP